MSRDVCGKCDKREWVTNPSTQETYHRISSCCLCARAALRRVEKLEGMIVAGDRLNSMYDSGLREEAARIAKRRGR